MLSLSLLEGSSNPRERDFTAQIVVDGAGLECWSVCFSSRGPFSKHNRVKIRLYGLFFQKALGIYYKK